MLKPLFYSVFRARAFWAKLSKKRDFGHPPKRERLKSSSLSIFWFVLFFFFFSFFLFFFFSVFFWRVNGHVRWPEGPPHLALNPPYLFFLFLFFFWRVKGQVRWPEGPPHLALNPSYLFFFVFFGSFHFLIEKHCFLPEKGIFCLFFSVSLSFSIAFVGLLLFHFVFLCLSLFLSFLPSFLSFFFVFFWFLVFVSFFFWWFLLYFCFMKGTTSKYSITKLLFINPFSFLLVSSLLFSFKSPFLSFFFFFSDFKFVFVQHQCFS